MLNKCRRVVRFRATEDNYVQGRRMSIEMLTALPSRTGISLGDRRTLQKSSSLQHSMTKYVLVGCWLG